MTTTENIDIDEETTDNVGQHEDQQQMNPQEQIEELQKKLRESQEKEDEMKEKHERHEKWIQDWILEQKRGEEKQHEGEELARRRKRKDVEKNPDTESDEELDNQNHNGIIRSYDKKTVKQREPQKDSETKVQTANSEEEEEDEELTKKRGKGDKGKQKHLLCRSRERRDYWQRRIKNLQKQIDNIDRPRKEDDDWLACMNNPLS